MFYHFYRRMSTFTSVDNFYLLRQSTTLKFDVIDETKFFIFANTASTQPRMDAGVFEIFCRFNIDLLD